MALIVKPEIADPSLVERAVPFLAPAVLGERIALALVLLDALVPVVPVAFADVGEDPLEIVAALSGEQFGDRPVIGT